MIRIALIVTVSLAVSFVATLFIGQFMRVGRGPDNRED